MSFSVDKSYLIKIYKELANKKTNSRDLELIYLRQAYIINQKDISTFLLLTKAYEKLEFYDQVINLIDKISSEDTGSDLTLAIDLLKMKAYSKLYTNKLDDLSTEFSKIQSMMIENYYHKEKINQITETLEKELPQLKNNPKVLIFSL